MIRRISRRELLGLGAAAGVFAASGTGAGAAPERGGSLRIGMAGRGIGTFDGRVPFDPVMRVLGHGSVFDCLTEITASGALAGELAESWSASPDARVWTFRLREGVAFHNGKPFGAGDVVATLRLHMAAPMPAATAARQIAQVRQTGAHTVQVVLKSGNTGLPFLMADPQLIILPEGHAQEAMAHGIGTGLYRVEAGRSAHRAVLRRADRHYKDGQAGWFDRVEVLVLPDPRQRLETLRAGRVDVISAVDPAWLRDFARSRRVAVAGATASHRLELAVLGLSASEREVVRTALALSLDRDEIVARTLQGRGVVATDEPLCPVGASARSARNPEAARRLLSDAGLSGLAVDVRIAEARVPGAVALRAGVEEALRAAGLTLRSGADAQIAACLRPGRPTEDWALDPGAASAGTEYGAGLAALRASLDPSERASLLDSLRSEWPRHSGVVVPAFADGLVAHSTRLGRPERLGAFWDLDSARIAERWWVA